MAQFLPADEAWTRPNLPKAVKSTPIRAEGTRTLTMVAGRASTDDKAVSIGAPFRGVVGAIPTGRSDELTRQGTSRVESDGGCCGAADGRPRKPLQPSPTQSNAPMDSLAVVLFTVLSFGLSVGIAGVVLDRILRVTHRAAGKQPAPPRSGPAAT